MNARYFARHQYRDYVIYKALAKNEPDKGFKEALLEITEYEHEDYLFWRKLSSHKQFSVNKLEVLFFRILRKFFGLTFTIKVLDRRAKNIVNKYKKYRESTASEELKKEIGRLLEHEALHEKKLVSHIKEDRVKFISNIILGINDGLVELSGALIGFSFALQEQFIIASAGFIMGISASLSMASSAYMQARYEGKKNPHKAGIYTGIAYFVVVFMQKK